MADGIYVALSGAVARSQELEAVANNLANLNTAGYRAQRATFSSVLATRQAVIPASPIGPERRLSFPIDRYHALEQSQPARFTQGGFIETGADLDLALEGDGLFVIENDGARLYTRDGHFLRDAEGYLVTTDGARVQGVSGPVQLPTGRVTVDETGKIAVDGRVITQLLLVSFPADTLLERMGANRFRTGSTEQRASARVRQGVLEGAAVSAMTEMLRLIDVHRGFDALQEAIRVYRDLDAQVNAAGKPA